MFSLIFLAITLVIVYYIHKYNKVPKELEHIPIVSSIPTIIANIQQKPTDEVHDMVDKNSKGHPIYLSQFLSFWLVTIRDDECAKDLFSLPDDLAPKLQFEPGNGIYELFGNGLVFSNGEIWRTYRRLASIAFNSALHPEFVGETILEFFEFMEPNLNQPIDIYETIQRPVLEILGKLAFKYKFGCLESKETPHIVEVYKFLIATVESGVRTFLPWLYKLPTEYNKKFYRYMKEFDEFIINIIETRRNEIKNNEKKIPNGEHVDLLTNMLEIGEKEGFHVDQKRLRDDMKTFFVAGHDTTTMSLNTALYYLAKHPEIQEKARSEVINILGNEPVIPTSDQLKEMTYIMAIIRESLRILPPSGWITLRKLSQETKIGPYILPKDTLCSVNIWALHHNPKYWENPKQFIPERFLNNEKRNAFTWAPFSGGPRNCVGQNFSLMEQKVILSMLLLKYTWTLPENSINKDKMILEPRYLLRPLDLKLIFNERNAN